MTVLYHPDTTNIVVDAHSGMTMGSVSHHDESKKDLAREIHRLARLGVRMQSALDGSSILRRNSESSLVVKVKSK